jgi:ABC-type transport system involved in cytochrome c biogenesis permease subunit
MLEATTFCHYSVFALYAAAFLCALAGRGVAAFGRWAAPLATLGFVIQAGLLGARWTSAGFLPVTGLFSTLHFLTLWMMAITLYFVWRYDAEPLLPGTLALSLLALLGAVKGDMALAPLTPALDTPLFFLHVATSFAAYGLFSVAALVALHRTLGVSASVWGHDRRMLDECLYLGYILFSWCMIAGSLWAYLAWGSYWTWRLKGLWSMILWFYYSGVMHVRNRGRWQEWPLNLLVIAGMALMLFTYLGLGLLFPENSHPLK